MQFFCNSLNKELELVTTRTSNPDKLPSEEIFQTLVICVNLISNVHALLNGIL